MCLYWCRHLIKLECRSSSTFTHTGIATCKTDIGLDSICIFPCHGLIMPLNLVNYFSRWYLIATDRYNTSTVFLIDLSHPWSKKIKGNTVVAIYKISVVW